MTIFHVIKYHSTNIRRVDFDNLPDEIKDQWLLTPNFHSRPLDELLDILKQLLLEYDPNDNL